YGASRGPVVGHYDGGDDQHAVDRHGQQVGQQLGLPVRGGEVAHVTVRRHCRDPSDRGGGCVTGKGARGHGCSSSRISSQILSTASASPVCAGRSTRAITWKAPTVKPALKTSSRWARAPRSAR